MSYAQIIRNTSSKINYVLHQYWIDCQDPRTKEWFLVDISPFTFAFIMASYILLAKSIGPKLMKNREPMQLRGLMLTYNVVMILINAFFFVQVVINCEYGKRFLDFKYPDRSDTSAKAIWELKMGWWYWMTKFLDLLDTAFFVLRKKNSHISFLHLYHHTSVPLFGWLCLKHNAVMPATALFALINSFIHTIMYSYYALSALGPQVRKYLWWKRYLTQLQLAQFLFGMIYGTIMVFAQTGYPIFWFWFGWSQPPFFFYMFFDFYRNSYVVKNKEN